MFRCPLNGTLRGTHSYTPWFKSAVVYQSEYQGDGGCLLSPPISLHTSIRIPRRVASMEVWMRLTSLDTRPSTIHLRYLGGQSYRRSGVLKYYGSRGSLISIITIGRSAGQQLYYILLGSTWVLKLRGRDSASGSRCLASIPRNATAPFVLRTPPWLLHMLRRS